MTLLFCLSLIFSSCEKAKETDGNKAEDKQDHSGHDHGGDDTVSIKLSDQASKNIGLKIDRVKFGPFVKTVTFPGMIIDKSSQTKTVVATPMTGIVTHLYVKEGQAVMPNTLLFKLRLTHEDLVQIQSDYLEILGKLDVENKELIRLKNLKEGIVAAKVVLARQYAIAKLQAVINAKKESLELHGLSESQIKQIEKDRKLLKELSIYAPSFAGKSEKFILTQGKIKAVSYINKNESKKRKPVYIVQNLKATKGKSLKAGETLCTLADYHNLLIEGAAFEQDSAAITKAADDKWSLTAFREGKKEPIKNLNILYLSNSVDTDTRALHFYINLPNEITRDVTTEDGAHYINWKYKAGERVQLRVPVEKWKKRIVVPVDAVVQDGAEYFAFRKKGNNYIRIPVHVEYKDREWCVVQNDGSLKLGWKIAFSGAYQIQTALKNKAGGGVDPHAGHNH